MLITHLLDRLRFIFVVGGAGLFTFLTAAAGLIGAARNSHAWLAVYAFMAVLLLLAQVLPPPPPPSPARLPARSYARTLTRTHARLHAYACLIVRCVAAVCNPCPDSLVLYYSVCIPQPAGTCTVGECIPWHC